MRPYQQITAVVCAALGAFMIVQGVVLKLEGAFGPGPGFMAFVVGVLLVTVSLVWFARVSLAPAESIPDELLPEPGGLGRVAIVLVALFIFAAVFAVIGFKLSMLGFLLATFFVFGRDHVALKIVIALLASFGLHYVFLQVLKVSLPEPTLEILRIWGF